MEEDLFGEMNQFLDVENPEPVILQEEEQEQDIETLVEDAVIDSPENVDKEKEVIDGREESIANNDTSSLLFSFASTLVEDGVLPSLDLSKAEIKTTEDLISAIREEIKANEFGDLTPEQKEAVNAFRNGIPIEKYVARKQEGIQLASITRETLENNDELRKELIKRDFLSKGYSEDKADKFVQRSIDLGEDVDDALESLEAQKKLLELQTQREIEQNQARTVEAEKQYAKQLETLKTTVYNEKNEVIPGIKFNKNVADKVYESMTKVVEEVDGQPLNKLMKDRLENPVDFEYRLHYLYTLTKGFKDFSKLQTTEKTNAIRNFEKNLGLNTFNQSKQSKDYNPDLDVLERILGNS